MVEILPVDFLPSLRTELECNHQRNVVDAKIVPNTLKFTTENTCFWGKLGRYIKISYSDLTPIGQTSFMNIIHGITLILVYQLLGEVTSRALDLSIPGPVIGMLYLFLTLLWIKQVPKVVEQTSKGLLNHLSLMFVPAGVGMMVYFEQISQEWMPIGVTLIISTVLTILVTAWLMQWVMRWLKRRENAHDA